MTLFTDNRTLKQLHAQLMEDIHCCDNMLTGNHEEDDPELVNDIESMSEQLDEVELLISLKWSVDCDCFYKETPW